MNKTVEKRYGCSVPSIKSTIENFNRIYIAGQKSLCKEMRCALNNRYSEKMIVQAKLEIGQNGDACEREADRVAAVVMQMSETESIRIKELFRKKKIPIKGIGLSPGLEACINSLKGGGHPLPASIRSFFEPHFGCDFSHVRIHTDARGAEIAQALNARAFTMGYDVVFASGQYSPWTMAGQMLLAHELVHVIQQTGDRIICGEGTELIQCAGNIDPILQAVILGEKVIKRGEKGPAVKIIQQALMSAGVPLPKYGADSDFGSETETAVRKFQESNGLLSNGIVDLNTIRKLAMVFPPLTALLPATPPVTPPYPVPASPPPASPPIFVPPSPPPADGFWYTVKSGDWLDKIAKSNGLSSWKEIYYHENNKAFRVKRPDPNKIFPGDQLWIPKKTTVIESTQPVINEFYGRLMDYDNLPEMAHNMILPADKSIVLHWNVEHAEQIKIQSMTLDGTISEVALPEYGRVPDMNQPNIGKVTIIPAESATFTLFVSNKFGTAQYYRHINALLYRPRNTSKAFSVEIGPDCMDLLEGSAKPPVISFSPKIQRFRPANAGLRASRNPEMLEFIETDIRLSERDPFAIRKNERDEAVRLLLQMEGFGVNNNPVGRRGAYVDILFWGKDETEINRKGYETCPDDCKLSSCGLVVRSLWLLLGARDQPEWGRLRYPLNPPYVVGSAIAGPLNFAEKCGALIKPKTDNGFKIDEFLNLKPGKGDAIFLQKGELQHIFTLIDTKDNKFISIDGGNPGCKGRDGKCCGIKRTERILETRDGYARFKGEPKPIMRVVKFDNLIDYFVAPMVTLVKNKGNNPGIDPCPP